MLKEDFLHYIWKFQKFSPSGIKTENGEEIEILTVGAHNKNSGPDFTNAQLRIAGQHWAGNVEIHIKSSHWYAHHHEKDPAYNNVILHVVWEHDVEVFNSNNIAIPTLVLKDRVDGSLLNSYGQLLKRKKTFVNCEKHFNEVDIFRRKHWLERLFFERLHQKSEGVQQQLEATKQDWEAVLFRLLMRNFGLNINGEAFLQIALSVPFSVVRKLQNDANQLEALLFGLGNLLDEDCIDTYFIRLKQEFTYIEHKFRLRKSQYKPQFFKLRPGNFPTIRLSQMAALYHNNPNLFQKVIGARTKTDFYTLFRVEASGYWNDHYTFKKKTNSGFKKRLSTDFIDLLLINTILPIKFVHAMNKGLSVEEELLGLVTSIAKESNTLIDRFEQIGAKPVSAFQSQALLQLYKNYCQKNKCLQCQIGVKLIG